MKKNWIIGKVFTNKLNFCYLIIPVFLHHLTEQVGHNEHMVSLQSFGFSGLQETHVYPKTTKNKIRNLNITCKMKIWQRSMRKHWLVHEKSLSEYKVNCLTEFTSTCCCHLSLFFFFTNWWFSAFCSYD